MWWTDCSSLHKETLLSKNRMISSSSLHNEMLLWFHRFSQILSKRRTHGPPVTHEKLVHKSRQPCWILSCLKSWLYSVKFPFERELAHIERINLTGHRQFASSGDFFRVLHESLLQQLPSPLDSSRRAGFPLPRQLILSLNFSFPHQLILISPNLSWSLPIYPCHWQRSEHTDRVRVEQWRGWSDHI
jgi:hypothetical protein